LCSLVADGGDGLQVCYVAANILDKQLSTADNELPSSMETEWETNISSLQKSVCYEM
jgi:hypothetical protein